MIQPKIISKAWRRTGRNLCKEIEQGIYLLRLAHSDWTLVKKHGPKLIASTRPVKGPDSAHIEDIISPHPIRTKSFAEAYPEAVAMWHYKKNCGWGPEDFSYGSMVAAWFKCPEGPDHVFRVRLVTMGRAFRSKSTTNGCGFCRSLRLSTGNTLASEFPHLAREWLTEKNGISPEQVVSGSNTTGWWRCEYGHIWRASPNTRTTKDSGCRCCNVGVSIDLRGYPEILKQFDFELNIGVDPHALPTKEKVHWICPEFSDHRWKAMVSRSNSVRRCPYCLNRKGSATNNLSLTHPELAAQWDANHNIEKEARNITSGSRYRAWWRCPKGPDHLWQAIVADRVTYKTGCPFCSSKKTSVTNVIATIAPHLLVEWHPIKNGEITPFNERAGSGKTRWWLCPTCSCEWQAPPYRRIAMGNGCPDCAVKRFVAGSHARFRKNRETKS